MDNNYDKNLKDINDHNINTKYNHKPYDVYFNEKHKYKNCNKSHKYNIDLELIFKNLPRFSYGIQF